MEIKSRYPESILFFRMGDFYEMFLDDALVAARILDITLTSRNKNSADEIPFCGVPFHSAQPYIARLVEAGHRVAICEQVEDPKQAKGIVKRDVVRVVTPALVTESESLTPDENCYLLALCQQGGRWGCAWLDLSTGEFKTSEEETRTGAAAMLASIGPRELLLAEGMRKELPEELNLLHGERTKSSVADWVLDHDYCSGLICNRFGIASPDAFGLDSLPLALLATGMVLHYLQENRHASLPHLRDISIIRKNDFLTLDPATRRNLELIATMTDNKKAGSLLGCLDRTATAMGARCLKQWLSYPLVQVEPIRQRLSAVEELVEQGLLRDQLVAGLKGMH
ncbi:MAG: DNA mismatch repair protein MutS, partial [Trichlorobacter sp.]|nr:DNA mismatch repair protein MutS [Trichlorobacter sp.]